MKYDFTHYEAYNLLFNEADRRVIVDSAKAKTLGRTAPRFFSKGLMSVFNISNRSLAVDHE